MPFVAIELSAAAATAERIGSLQTGVTALMADILHKKPELTAVAVRTAVPGGWSVGGTGVPLGAHLCATVTAGTNTAEEKARFIDAADRLLRAVLGPDLPLATYVVVDERPALSWGYGGLTQGERVGAAVA